MLQAKTITIHLPLGDPDGIKIAEISNRLIRAYVIPRNLIAEAREFNELSSPSLYVLVSKDGDKAYVGETENFLNRIRNHDADIEKDYWDIAIVFIAKDSSLEISEVKYLESIACERAQKANKAEVKNRTAPSRNNLHAFNIPVIEEIFEDCSLLISSFGYPIFDILTEEEITESEIWICNTNKTEAKAIFEGSRFTILAGSKIDIHYSETWAKSHPGSLKSREQIFEKYGVVEGGVVTLNDNIAFKSPNTAGGFAAGRSVNAWTTWKNKDGKTMDQILR